jgi:hypothetical protein
VTTEGQKHLAVLPVNGSSDQIMLQEQTSGPKLQQNLARVASDSSIVWRAELPDHVLDFFVAVRWVDGRLLANSWSCWLVEFDQATGRVLNSVFTK